MGTSILKWWYWFVKVFWAFWRLKSGLVSMEDRPLTTKNNRNASIILDCGFIIDIEEHYYYYYIVIIPLQQWHQVLQESF